uniref:Uncharacterized protein n=1 Tax=Rhizophora mucronata TaxID=61149 RepID=A0A2P2NLK6_RHIMU
MCGYSELHHLFGIPLNFSLSMHQMKRAIHTTYTL